MDSEYDYTMAAIAIDSLTQQIQQSTIVTALDYITALGTQVSIFFKAALSTADKATLDAVVAAHNGVPLPQNQVQNVNVTNNATVTTQFEQTNKVLKLACSSATVNSSGTAIVSVKVPGTFGSGQGRYVIGGYGISADYNFGDIVTCRIEDTDRIIAWKVALAINPAATSPVSDAFIQGMGIIPNIGQSFPQYPIVQSYTDDDMPSTNQGWFFWPLALGNSLPPIGEVEINPIGGYGFIPAGFYVIITYQRPSGIITGAINVNFDWGKEIS